MAPKLLLLFAQGCLGMHQFLVHRIPLLLQMGYRYVQVSDVLAFVLHHQQTLLQFQLSIGLFKHYIHQLLSSFLLFSPVLLILFL